MDPYSYRELDILIPITMSIGLQLAVVDPPRYGFQLYLHSLFPKNVLQGFLHTIPKHVVLENQERLFREEVGALALASGPVTDDDLVSPAVRLLAVYQAALALFDHEAAHPDQEEGFSRVPEGINDTVRALAEVRHEGMANFRELGLSREAQGSSMAS